MTTSSDVWSAPGLITPPKFEARRPPALERPLPFVRATRQKGGSAVSGRRRTSELFTVTNDWLERFDEADATPERLALLGDDVWPAGGSMDGWRARAVGRRIAVTRQRQFEREMVPGGGPAAMHEAGHAAMLWVLGFRATDVYVDTYWSGAVENPGKMDPRSCVLFNLAGYAAESQYQLWGPVDLAPSKTTSQDFTHARVLLNHYERLRHRFRGEEVERDEIDVLDVEAALRRYFDMACEMLYDHKELVEWLTEELEEHYRLSARQVAAITRAYDREQELAATAMDDD